MSMNMSRREREAFLRGVHVGVLSVARAGRPPLTAPVWYDYAPELGLWLITGGGSRKGKALAAAREFSLCAQNEQAPYSYVTVEGPVISIEPADDEAHRRPMAHRYLGTVRGDQYIESGGPSDNVLVRMRPERWLSLDYAKQFPPETFAR